MTEIASGWAEHRDCEWEEVPPCVYCKVHGTRLYHGSLPAEKDMARSLDIQKGRFGISDQLAQVLYNTVEYLDWWTALIDGEADAS